MTTVEDKITLIELREALLAAEISKRMALHSLRVDAFLEACGEIKSLTNAIFNLEVKLLAQEKRDALLPPSAKDLRRGEDPPVCQ